MIESVLLSKYEGKCAGMSHSDGNTAMEASLLNSEIRRDPTSGRSELEADTKHIPMVLRNLGLENSTPVVNLVGKRPKSEELLLMAVYRSVTMRVNYLSLDRSHLSFATGPLA